MSFCQNKSPKNLNLQKESMSLKLTVPALDNNTIAMCLQPQAFLVHEKWRCASLAAVLVSRLLSNQLSGNLNQL